MGLEEARENEVGRGERSWLWRGGVGCCVLWCPVCVVGVGSNGGGKLYQDRTRERKRENRETKTERKTKSRRHREQAKREERTDVRGERDTSLTERKARGLTKKDDKDNTTAPPLHQHNTTTTQTSCKTFLVHALLHGANFVVNHLLMLCPCLVSMFLHLLFVCVRMRELITTFFVEGYVAPGAVWKRRTRIFVCRAVLSCLVLSFRILSVCLCVCPCVCPSLYVSVRLIRNTMSGGEFG